MNGIRSKQRQRGLSLVELMIAITLSLVLTLGVVQIFSSSKQTNRTQTALGGIQENARFALDLLSYDIRMAGNIGCNRNAAVTNNATAANLPAVGNGIQGYEHGGLPAVLITGSPNNPGGDDVTENTDTLVIRYASPNTVGVVNSLGNAITLASDADIKVAAPFIISDCQSADIFTASAIAGTALTANANLSKSYGSDAEVAPLKYVAYYIGLDADTGHRNLYRRVVNGIDGSLGIQGEEPLLEGVEGMEILYGQTFANGNTRYVPAGTADLDMEQVTSVRLALTISSVDNNANKLSRSFTTTIKLRNHGIGL